MSNQLQITGDLKVKSLTGALTATAGVVTSVPLGAANGVATLGTDGKVPSAQLPTMGSSYKGTWNAATNTPTIADGVGTAGDYYLVSTGGTWNGIVFLEGNTVIYSGTVWQKAGGGSGTVTSVALAAPAAFSVSGSPVTSTGTLTLAGAGTTNDYIKGDGTLGVFGSTAISAVSGTYLALAGGIMTGQIVLKEGTTISDYTKGLRFPNDPYGGSGDTSGLRLYAETTTGAEAQVLELYITNDGAGTPQDRINFQAPSNDLVTINGNKIWNAGNLTPQTQLNGTGFVKATGTTISYDNTSYLPLEGGTLTGALSGTSATFSGLLNTTAGNGISAGGTSFAINPSATRGIINLGGSTDNFLTFASKGYIGVGATYMQVLAQAGVALSLVSDANTVLSFALSTGAATFSSSVTAGGFGAFTAASNGSPVLTLGTAGAINAVINTADEMFFNIDSNNDQTGASFIFGTNRTGTTGGNELVRFQDNGNVGIGTSTIGSTLQINGNAAIGFNSSTIAPNNGLAVSGIVQFNTTATYSSIYKFVTKVATDRNIAFGIQGGDFSIESFNDAVNASTPLRIYASKLSYLGGNLLINSTTDLGAGYKLQVNGSISMDYANFFNFKGSSGAGDVLVDNSGSSLRVTGSVDISSSTLIQGLLTNYNSYNTQTGNYTLVLADASKIVEMNVGSANTVTVPLNSSVAFPIGTEITVLQYGAGVTTIVAASGVTFRSKDFGTRIGDQYTGATLIKKGTNEWYLIGNIQP